MSTPDRPEGALAPWTPSQMPAALVPAVGWDPAEPEAAPAKMFSPRVIIRALKRHWWHILALWAVGASVGVYLAQTRIKPMYDAVSWLEVMPPAQQILTQTNGSGDLSTFLETQVLLVTNPDVLSEALHDPAVAGTAKVRSMAEPEQELRKEIGVGVPQRGTNVIQVKMSTENPSDGANIVNAVVKSYLAYTKTWTDEAANEQIIKLKEMEDGLKQTVSDLENKVRDLTKKLGQANRIKGDEKDGNPAKTDPTTVGKMDITLEQYRQLNLRLADLTTERFGAESTVSYLEKELQSRQSMLASAAGNKGPVGPPSPEQIEKRIENEFYRSPDAVALKRDYETANQRYEAARKRTVNRADPTFRRAKEEKEDAEARYKSLWESMYPGLKERVTIAAANGGATGDGPASDPMLQDRERALMQAKSDLERVKAREKALSRELTKATVEVQDANEKIVDVKFAESKLEENRQILATVAKHREQRQYEAQQGARIRLRSKARVSRSPSSDNRTKATLAAPVVTLLLSCLLFVALEFRSGRVADPEELSQRIRVGVIGVVPPLPSLAPPTRALSARSAQNEKRKVEEFVQSLDHLRVTLTAPRPGQVDHRRCVLITSATGGEGKTTLAAQLAGRCANAGLMTLLIDADLRRPSLGDLLEVPEGPGFVDVLEGEASPEAAMVVIGNAGGFHLLPAGTLGRDPSRLLHGERLGRLIAQFRETFDIVIIDAPPVLAVPDALLLGRWTDGAILAVRHDTSRFPLVERANKRLASVGVGVLGAVVNGCRTMESAYGSYRYTPYAAAETAEG